MKCEKCKEPLTRIKGSNNWISKIDATIYCTGTTRKHTPFHEPAEPVAIPLRKVGEGIYTADTGLIRPASLSLPITVDPNWCEVHQVIMSSCEADRRKGCRMGTRPEMPLALDRVTLAEHFAHEYAYNLHPDEAALTALFLKYYNECTSRFTVAVSVQQDSQ